MATEGRSAGQSSTGALILRPTSTLDRSPKTGARPVRHNPNHVPLYGWTDLDLPSVAAPVMLDDTLIPLPNSRDPVRPGVLVLIQNWEDPGRDQQPVLLIGTLSNLRDQVGWEDGPGIALWVRQIDTGGFSGTWGKWGILVGGRGYSCAQVEQRQ